MSHDSLYLESCQASQCQILSIRDRDRVKGREVDLKSTIRREKLTTGSLIANILLWVCFQ